MEDDNSAFAVVFCILIIFASGLLVGFCFGDSLGKSEAENRVYQEAHDENAGHWGVDPRTGETVFIWTGEK